MKANLGERSLRRHCRQLGDWRRDWDWGWLNVIAAGMLDFHICIGRARKKQQHLPQRIALTLVSCSIKAAHEACHTCHESWHAGFPQPLSQWTLCRCWCALDVSSPASAEMASWQPSSIGYMLPAWCPASHRAAVKLRRLAVVQYGSARLQTPTPPAPAPPASVVDVPIHQSSRGAEIW